MRAPRNHLSTKIPYFKGLARLCGCVSQNTLRINTKERRYPSFYNEREEEEKEALRGLGPGAPVVPVRDGSL